MNIEREKNRLMQGEMLNTLVSEPKLTDMLTVYLHDVGKSHNRGIHSILVPINKKENVLSDFSWDMQSTDGKPNYYVYGGDRPVYLRFGNDNGYEPLLIYRDFNGIKPNYIEICEEFRLFHDLYHDSINNQYIKIDDSGNTNTVILIEENAIKVRVQELKQFLAIKEMYLSIQFDFREHTSVALSDLELDKEHDEKTTELATWIVGYGDMKSGEENVFSRLCGKKLIEPMPKSKSGLYGFSEEKKEKHIEFIIDVSTDGYEITSSSNVSQIDYLTQVFFKKEVLDKYYQKPSKYSVEPSYLRCGNLWGMMMDNDQKDVVCAWLGDLGRDLPYEEKLHWRSYNIPPNGSMSKSFFRQQILAEFAESESVEHIFKASYRKFYETSSSILGEYLILSLKKEDSHYFDTIRVPATNEQIDFDSLILGLAKVLIDSLNEKYINKYLKSLTSDVEFKNIKGSISKLEKTFNLHHVSNYEGHISFLRNLQTLRSSSSAHRKGTGYKQALEKFKINTDKDLRTGIEDILKQSCDFLDFMTVLIIENKLNFKNE